MSNLRVQINPYLYSTLDANSYGYLKRMFAGGLQRYNDRLKAIGFTGMNRVLDAGCGFGQWSIAMANYNKEIYSVDIEKMRIFGAQMVATHNAVSNIYFACSSLEETPFPAEYFDGIFCYSTIHQTNEKKILDEFSRIIKKGGILYLNFNCPGWFIYFLWNRGILRKNRYALHCSIRALGNFFLKRESGYHAIKFRGLIKKLRKRNYSLIAINGDGMIRINNGSSNVLSFYSKYYFGFRGVWEILAQKIR